MGMIGCNLLLDSVPLGDTDGNNGWSGHNIGYCAIDNQSFPFLFWAGTYEEMARIHEIAVPVIMDICTNRSHFRYSDTYILGEL